METHELMSAAIEAVGAKRLSRAWGISLGHTYRLARHPMDADEPDATGSVNPLDRLEALADLCAAHPEGGPVLEGMRLWMDALFARVLRVSRGAPITEASLLGHVSSVMREVSELIASADPRTLDGERRARLRSEAVDVLAVVQALICDIDAEAGQEQQDRRLRPTG